MKYILIIMITLNFYCTENTFSDCNKELQEKDGFMLHGGILDKYDNGRVFISIQRINDPKDWDYNEYFTGDSFSKNESDLLRVESKDSCALKEKYFKYINAE